VKFQTNDGVIFAVYRKGGMFGDLEVLHSSPRESTAVTLEESLLLVLSWFDFWKLIEEFPEMGIKLKNWAF